MIVHTFGNNENKAVMLIHGMLNPWQIWEDAVSVLSKDYFVIVPELDAHTEDKPSRFISVEKEAEQLKEYLIKNHNGELYALCGLSMGGRIAATLAGMDGIKTKHLVLDGAPLKKMPKILIGFIKAISASLTSQKSVIRKSSRTASETSCPKDTMSISSRLLTLWRTILLSGYWTACSAILHSRPMIAV